MGGDAQTRNWIMEHWRACEQRDSATEHAIYANDAILDYPQSGERFPQPRDHRCAAQWPSGGPALYRAPDQRHRGNLGERERGHLRRGALLLVSIMGFCGGFVAHETQDFADPCEPAKWRAELAERMPGRPG